MGLVSHCHYAHFITFLFSLCVCVHTWRSGVSQRSPSSLCLPGIEPRQVFRLHGSHLCPLSHPIGSFSLRLLLAPAGAGRLRFCFWRTLQFHSSIPFFYQDDDNHTAAALQDERANLKSQPLLPQASCEPCLTLTCC